MPEIIHLPYGTKPSPDGPCAVIEWKDGGSPENRPMPGSGSWQTVPDPLFDSLARAAENMADHVGYDRVYIIGRPER